MNCWWAISAEAFMDALLRVQAGDDPEIVYLEEYANATHHEGVPVEDE